MRVILLLPRPLDAIAAVLLAMICLLIWPVGWAIERLRREDQGS